MDLRDKVALVTGASGGIGGAAARLLADRGVRLATSGRSGDALHKLAQDIPGLLTITADLTETGTAGGLVSRVLEHFGRLDILVNCAGQGYDVSVEKADPQKFLYLFKLHVLAPLALMQAAIPLMRAQGGGTIVNVTSGTSLMTLANNGPYSATKRALNGLTLTAAEEVREDGIRVSLVYPFMTETAFEERTTAFSDPAGLITEEEGEQRRLPPLDPPEHVAGLILTAIQSGQPEIYAHDWMRR